MLAASSGVFRKKSINFSKSPTTYKLSCTISN